jgi:DNA-binding XRE family transcriptional regulator
MVSTADSSGRGEVLGTPKTAWKVWDLEAELEANPKLREYMESDEHKSFERELVLSHQIYRLRLVRKRLDITQVELAKRMGVSQIRISQIENGKLESFELGTLIRYVEALGGKLSMSVELEGKHLELLNIADDTLDVWGN